MGPHPHVPSRTPLLLLLALASLLAGAAPVRAQEPVRVLVAVMPFRIHSQAPLGHLETALADLIATRLEASGRVRVVDTVVVRESLLGYAAGELTETAVRRLGRQLGAQYVVAGSLTELAGRFSLDLRITPVDSLVSSDTLVTTAASQDELLDRINELAEEILARVTRAPRPTVAEVRLEGAEELARELRALLSVRAGAPYEGAAVERDLASLRASPGVAAVRVETQREPEGVIVTYRVVPSARILGAPSGVGSADRVAEVRIRGNRRIEADAIRARIATRPGDAYRAEQLAQDVREVHALGFFRNIRVLSEDTPDGRILVFEVEENPVVRRVSVSGNDSIDSEKIRDALTLTTGSTLDYPLLYENRLRVEQLYRDQGFYLARVRHNIEPIADGAVSVDFEVEERGKQRLREIRFVGNQHFTDRELRSGFKTRPWRFWSYATRYFDRSGTYSEPLFAQDLANIERKYTNAGYIQVEVAPPRVDVVEEGLVVTVEVREGDRFEVGSIDVVGDDTVDLDALRELLKLSEGEWFDRSGLTSDVEALTAHYTDRGFYFATVNPRTQLQQAEHTVDVVFEVQKGPLYFIREIDISGNTTTVDTVIRREMQIVEGQLYSARALRISQARARSLGFFEEVTFEPRPTDRADQLDLGVRVLEKPTGSLSFGAGFSSLDRFVISGSLSQANLFGRGYAVELSADVGGRSDRFFLSVADPYFLGSDFSATATLFRTDVKFVDFEEKQTGINLSLGHILDEEGKARGFLRYNFASREIEEENNVNASSPIFREILSGAQSTSLVGLAVRLDTRDDRIAPTEGYQLSGGVEVAGLGGFSKFVRFEARGAYNWLTPEWFPIFPEKSVFSFGARMGWALPFNDVSDYDLPDPRPFDLVLIASSPETSALGDIDTDLKLPLSERYFLGGLGTFQLRGYRARSVGPRRPILTRSQTFGSLLGFDNAGNAFSPVGRDPSTGACIDRPDEVFNLQGDGDGRCNSLSDRDDDDFDDLDETDVIGGNKFFAMSVDYRFPISETLGLLGILFLDMGNAFAEDDFLWDVGQYRFSAGFGALWFSPFGPLQGFVGFPLNPLEVEDSSAFEFSVGGTNF